VVENYVVEQDSVELLLISRDGQVEQLTNLNSYSKTFILDYSWSPDGRYIAAWVFTGSWLEFMESGEAELVVVDTNTRQVTDYCVRVKYRDLKGLYSMTAPTAPLWSPDGKQLVVMDWYEKDHRRVILVDPARGFAAQIAEDMEPVGWMLPPASP
jgi:Tol biopolymer transport system component